MSFYFQPAIFRTYLLPMAPSGTPSILVVPFPRTISMPLYWQPAPVFVPTPHYASTSNIRIKIIFHRAGTVLASNDAYYNYTPNRETVLANLSWWSIQHKLGDRVYSGQCTLYTTRSQYSKLEILPEVGPITPQDNVRKLSFADKLTTSDFQSMMLQIATNNYGAFILVDTAPPSTRQASPATSNTPKESVNSDDKQPNNTGDSNNDVQIKPGPEDQEPDSHKGDDTEPSLGGVDGPEPEQSGVDEESVTNS
ncbi:hypothetical protein FLONG3_5409 [Fusarium longipes]|uniref:Uncharacterized protein n=1 Tax=Fusarium longipes TaxID=694270 RepID=A0A395SU51_9HYPO|nr:hypothetical protein FLONG3_5409 [Fusarium longipes]